MAWTPTDVSHLLQRGPNIVESLNRWHEVLLERAPPWQCNTLPGRSTGDSEQAMKEKDGRSRGEAT
jgi:hypothetical protein